MQFNCNLFPPVLTVLSCTVECGQIRLLLVSAREQPYIPTAYRQILYSRSLKVHAVLHPQSWHWAGKLKLLEIPAESFSIDARGFLLILTSSKGRKFRAVISALGFSFMKEQTEYFNLKLAHLFFIFLNLSLNFHFLSFALLFEYFLISFS